MVANAAALTKNTPIAVMDFGTRPGATTAEININNAEYTSSEYIITQLLKRSLFAVVDKDMVMHKLKERNLKTTGIIDQDTAKEIGNILGVRHIVYGNVAGVTTSDSGVVTPVAGVSVCTVKAHIVARIMDVDTGDILMVTRGEGESKSSYTGLALPNLPATVTIGTKTVTMASVHNAIQKAAFDTVDKTYFKVTGKKLEKE